MGAGAGVQDSAKQPGSHKGRPCALARPRLLSGALNRRLPNSGLRLKGKALRVLSQPGGAEEPSLTLLELPGQEQVGLLLLAWPQLCTLAQSCSRPCRTWLGLEAEPPALIC